MIQSLPIGIDRRPLYLDPTEATQILLDGPALRIRVKHQAERNLPLRCLSRIIANEQVEFTTAALLACAERGITLTWLNAEGSVRARLLGQAGERQELRQRLLDLLSRPDWQELYQGWLFAVDRQARLAVHHQLGVPETVGIGRQFEHWLEQVAVQLSTPVDAANSRLWLRQLSDAWMLNHANQLGFGADSELLLDGWPDLVGDLSHILHWALEPIRVGWLRRRYCWAERKQKPLTMLQRRELIRLYEHHSNRIARQGKSLTNRLHIWLVELA